MVVTMVVRREELPKGRFQIVQMIANALNESKRRGGGVGELWLRLCSDQVTR